MSFLGFLFYRKVYLWTDIIIYLPNVLNLHILSYIPTVVFMSYIKGLNHFNEKGTLKVTNYYIYRVCI